MIYCRYCARDIHEAAATCPHCGGVQQPAATAARGGAWLSGASLALGIVCLLALLDDSEWDEDTIVGLVLFAVTGIVLGAISLGRQRSGLAIAGVVLSGLGLLAAIGMVAG